MAFGLYFDGTGFTPEKYDEALGRLEAAGAGSPAGRTYHFALETEGRVAVFDVWESMEQFEAFGATLLPILGELGVDPGQPMVAEIRNTIKG